MKNFLFFIAVLVFSSGNFLAQSENVNGFSFSALEKGINNSVEEHLVQFPNKKVFTSLKPFPINYVLEQDSLLRSNFQYEYSARFLSATLKQNQKLNCNFRFVPQFHSEVGNDFYKKQITFFQSAGIRLYAKLKNKLSFTGEFHAGMLREPNFTDTLISNDQILPGLGIAYAQKNEPTKSAKGIYSFQNFSGYLAYAPTSYLSFQLGKDKHFIGDGYRSLLLSDIANNYPFFKTTIRFLDFQYSVWYSWFLNIQDANGFKKDFKNKYGTFHYLSWNASKNVSVSFFENVVFQGRDTSRSRNFDPNYLNPVVFFRPVEYSLGSSDNAMMGLNLSVHFLKSIKCYSQLVLDEFYLKEIRARKGWWANKQGIQLGVKSIRFLGINHLTAQAEFNWVRPFTYSHGSPNQSYSHFNQPLAHPLGANFRESIALLTYKFKQNRFTIKLIYAQTGKDSASGGNIGQNIFLTYTSRTSEYGNYTGQGIKTDLLQAEFNVARILIADWNLRTELGCTYRIIKNEMGFNRKTPFVYFAIKTDLHNFYRDF